MVAGPVCRFAFGALALSTLATFAGLTITATAAEPSDEILIGLVTKTEVNPYFVKLRQAATAEAEKHGAKLLARFGKFDGDNEGQVAAIENFISAGVKGILITPSNSTGVLGAVKKARDKGILVIALDTATDPADAVDATLGDGQFPGGRSPRTIREKSARRQDAEAGYARRSARGYGRRSAT